MEPKKFQRRKENFICDHCGIAVRGDGYTDHCPRCLWSRHEDINPGDRRSGCRGMMKPAGFELKNGRYVISYRCEKCGYKHKVKAAEGDDFDRILEIT